MIEPPRDPQRGEDVITWAQQVSKYLRALRPRPGADVAPRIQSGGTVYELVRRRRAGGSGSAAVHPFQVTVAAPDPESEAENPPPRLQVEIDSWLMNGQAADAKVTITGLGAPFEIEPVEGRAKIFLEATVVGGAVTTVALRHGDEWDEEEFPEPVRFDPSPTDPDRTQDRAYCLLAYLEAQSEGNANYTGRPTIQLADVTYQIVQCVRENLLICKGCYEATGDSDILLFRPGHAPYVEL